MDRDPQELLASVAKAGAAAFYYMEDDKTWWDPNEEAAEAKAFKFGDSEHYVGLGSAHGSTFNGCKFHSRPRLLEAVGACSSSHIKSPLLYRRFPLEYKSDAHDLYYNTAHALEVEEDAKEEAFAAASLQDLILNAKIERTARQENVKIALEKQQSVKQVYKPIASKWNLTEKLRRGQVVYWQDYIEAQIARDHCRLFKSPFVVPRHDWGGGQFFFGKYIGGADDAAGSGGAWGGGAGASFDDSDPSLDDVDDVDVDTSDAIDERDVTAAGNNVRGYNSSSYYNRVCQAIDSDKDLEPWHRMELQRGQIPQFFAQSNSGLVQVHPKDRLVSFYNLRTFGCMIDSVTKCPLVHMEVQEALTGLAHDNNARPTLDASNAASDAKNGKGETETQEKDPYHVTPEQVTKAREILASRRLPVQELPKSPRHGVRFRM